MLEDMSKTASIHDERERLMTSQIESLEIDLKFVSNSSEKKIKTLIEEKKQNELTFEDQTKFYGERETALEDNNERLKSMNLKLIEIFEKRENILNTEVEFMREEVNKDLI
jgi:GMP synthase PP-ATPase subunit